MGLGDEILFFLSNNPGNYRRLRLRMMGNLYLEDKLEQTARKRKELNAKENLLRVTLSKLKKNGLVKNDDHLWQLTIAGIKKLKDNHWHRHTPPQPKIKTNKKNRYRFRHS